MSSSLGKIDAVTSALATGNYGQYGKGPRTDGVLNQGAPVDALNAYPSACNFHERTNSNREQAERNCYAKASQCAPGPFKGVP